MRRSFIHTITLNGVREREHFYNLVHPTAYYTLNNIPTGPKLAATGISRKNSALITTSAKPATGTKTTVKKAVAINKVPTYEEVKPLLQKNTCLSCHNANTRQVGPAYVDVAKKKYTVAQIIALIHNPKPEHWPDYSTPMPPMPQVPTAEATKIAQWIRSLAK